MTELLSHSRVYASSIFGRDRMLFLVGWDKRGRLLKAAARAPMYMAVLDWIFNPPACILEPTMALQIVIYRILFRLCVPYRSAKHVLCFQGENLCWNDTDRQSSGRAALRDRSLARALAHLPQRTTCGLAFTLLTLHVLMATLHRCF